MKTPVMYFCLRPRARASTILSPTATLWSGEIAERTEAPLGNHEWVYPSRRCYRSRGHRLDGYGGTCRSDDEVAVPKRRNATALLVSPPVGTLLRPTRDIVG